MSDQSPVEPHIDDVRLVYGELCTSYHAIDDFRAKLLGFLPLASGTGIVLLLDDKTAAYKNALGAIGVFGFVITIGLFAYELYGLKKCHALIWVGKHLEAKLHVDGHFIYRPRELCGVINEPFAAGIIYPAVMAAWIYLALYFSTRNAMSAAILVFFVGFGGSLAYNLYLKAHPKPDV
jgi:hypothetical protein